ncbi:MAG: nucleotidyltransferase domain-containing protein [Candidatus Bathyarchaeota archaeon]|jgi:hypothetical protein
MATTEIHYTPDHWALLKRFREEALQMIKPLSDHHIQALVYGSIARGDIKPTSDIDIFIPGPPNPAILQSLIEIQTPITHREIIQATPNYAAKGYIHTAEKRSYSFPLVPLRSHEREFYRFAGSVDLQQLLEDIRVPGVDKRLKLIQPTPTGHTETPITGQEGTTAKTLGIGITAVLDRVRTLNRREKIGRTGVYLQRTLAPHEGFGETYHRLAKRRPPLRRRLRN